MCVYFVQNNFNYTYNKLNNSIFKNVSNCVFCINNKLYIVNDISRNRLSRLNKKVLNVFT